MLVHVVSRVSNPWKTESRCAGVLVYDGEDFRRDDEILAGYVILEGQVDPSSTRRILTGGLPW
jgi:hypothetical protein